MTTNQLLIWLFAAFYLVSLIKHYFNKDYRGNMHPAMHVISWIAFAAVGVLELYVIANYALPHR